MEMNLNAVLIVAGIVAVLIGVWLLARRPAERKPRSSSGGFAWALLFLSSGRMPPPPPQSQIEQDVDERKNRGSGADE